jgi:hypothetical protein
MQTPTHRNHNALPTALHSTHAHTTCAPLHHWTFTPTATAHHTSPANTSTNTTARKLPSRPLASQMPHPPKAIHHPRTHAPILLTTSISTTTTTTTTTTDPVITHVPSPMLSLLDAIVLIEVSSSIFLLSAREEFADRYLSESFWRPGPGLGSPDGSDI